MTAKAAATVIFALATAVPVYASSGSVADLDAATTARAETRQSDGMTLSQAVEQVRRQYGGRIISAETKRSGNREVHHIKVLTPDNKVKTVKVPGRRLNSRG